MLLKFQIDLYGTVKLNRKEMPQELVKKKIAKNENIAFHRGKVTTMKWKDKKDVTALSTVHTNDMVDVQYHNKMIRKPTIVNDYSKNMGTVDNVKQYIGDYSIARKRDELIEKYSISETTPKRG
ncbi:piggyBac transposable element-derived protein 4 [Trichonephila inaurata madagascariensis]|uniref:PiggyBac transposable element-derived protein 4 n=1 Tax=Trichonephila inaurata madagascariensis TaxID=2747483 RepID=A0A8X6XM68_9ARAC|nr:piggyBac transposable element-derived protein 4 [Trichonephila inaurata madagascariensis]